MPIVPEVRELNLTEAKRSLRLAGFLLEPDAAEWLDDIIVSGSRRLDKQTFGPKRSRMNRRRYRDARRSLTDLMQGMADAQDEVEADGAGEADAGGFIDLDLAQKVFADLCPLPPWCLPETRGLR
jgi:hypothetical protein